MRKTITEKVREHLIKCAQKKRTTTYSEIMDKFGFTTRELRPIFQELVDMEKNHELMSLVRSKATNKPSVGYFDSLKRKKDFDFKKATIRAFEKYQK